MLSTAFKAASTGPVPIELEIYSVPSSFLSLIVAVGNPNVPHTTYMSTFLERFKKKSNLTE